MADDSLKELDVVALTENLPHERLARGQVGTIVHVYGPDAFEVEFVDHHGRTYGLATLRGSQLLVLHYEPIAA
jgi:hypothetical protein